MDIPYIQWFPGHMTKTKRVIQKDISLVDIVIELLDARIPYSSQNPLINELIGEKLRITVLNKVDLADPNSTKIWQDYFANRGILVVLMDSKKGFGIDELIKSIYKLMEEKIKHWHSRGMTGRKVKAMIVGVTNVGKSSLINSLAGSKKTRVQDKPGVTRGRQWVNASKGLEILDTPGVLWPKFEDKRVGEKLAFTGAIKDEILDIELLAMRLIRYYLDGYDKIIKKRYDLYSLDEDLFNTLNEYEILEVIGKNRGMLLKRNEIDTKRAAIMLLDEFRGGILGRVTLELPEEIFKK